MSMRKIYIHIGCGKTGSSAIQFWLHNNASDLMKLGIYYPLFSMQKLNPAGITSGNGVHVMRAYAKGNLEELLGKVTRESDGDILVSSEAFQTLNENDLVRFKKILSDFRLEPIVIAYVRDVYDMVYSGYLQLVKRHLYARSFKEFVLACREIQQFNVVRMWSEAFDNIKVFHYDSEKSCLSNSFCDALNLDRKSIPAMPKTKFNRSLTLEEAELLRLINQTYSNEFENPDQSLSRIVSDALIQENPEAQTPILVDQDALNHVGTTFMDDIKWLNGKFFMGKDVVSIFNPEGKTISTEVPCLSKSIQTAIRTLIMSVDKFEFGVEEHAQRKAGKQEKLKVADPRIADALRDEAVKRERISLIDAFSLMSAAKTLRPSGAFIVGKVGEYKRKLETRKS